MRRRLLPLLALVLVTGCSKPAPPPPAPAPEPIVVQAPTATPPPSETTAATAIYHDIAAGYGKKPPVPAVPNACAPGLSSAPLTGEIKALDWAPYPGLTPTLWVPTVTLQLCNPGAVLPETTLRLESGGVDSFKGWEELRLPPLPTGTGTGPIKVYLPVGLPEGLFRLIEHGELPWPEIAIQLSYQGQAGSGFHSVTAGRLAVPANRTGTSMAQWRLPAEPTPALLRAVEWTGRRVAIGDKELFLYAPELSYRVLDLIGCNPPGGLGVESKEWSLWALPAGGAPRREGGLGAWRAQGSYTWVIEERPQIKQTFLLLHNPSHCEFPPTASIWFYDPGKGALKQPTITVGDKVWRAGAPTPVIQADGGLKTYDLTTIDSEGSWKEATYQWNQEQLNWSLPPGPSGTATTPGSVYPKRP